MGQAKGISGPCPLVWTSHMHTGQAFAEGHAGGTGVSGPRSQGGVVGATPAAGTLSATIAGEECTVVGDGTGGSAAGARGVASPGEKSGGVSHIKQQRTPVGGVLGSKARRWPGWRRGAKAKLRVCLSWVSLSQSTPSAATRRDSLQRPLVGGPGSSTGSKKARRGSRLTRRKFSLELEPKWLEPK